MIIDFTGTHISPLPPHIFGNSVRLVKRSQWNNIDLDVAEFSCEEFLFYS